MFYARSVEHNFRSSCCRCCYWQAPMQDCDTTEMQKMHIFLPYCYSCCRMHLLSEKWRENARFVIFTYTLTPEIIDILSIFFGVNTPTLGSSKNTPYVHSHVLYTCMYINSTVHRWTTVIIYRELPIRHLQCQLAVSIFCGVVIYFIW